MTRRAFSVVSVSSPDPARGQAPMSCANPFEGRGRGRAAMRRASGRLGPVTAQPGGAPVIWFAPSDAVSYRAGFVFRWQAFVRAEFRSIEALAAHFGVRFQTAFNWWQGLNCPSGYAVALAAMQSPGAFARAMGDAA